MFFSQLGRNTIVPSCVLCQGHPSPSQTVIWYQYKYSLVGKNWNMELVICSQKIIYLHGEYGCYCDNCDIHWKVVFVKTLMMVALIFSCKSCVSVYVHMWACVCEILSEVNLCPVVPRLMVYKWVWCTYTLVLRISFEIASSCISTPLPAFLNVFKAVLVSTSWNDQELFWQNWLNGLNVSVAMASQCSFEMWE